MVCASFRGAETFLGEQRSHSAADLISYYANFFQGLPFGIAERPVVSAKARHIWTLVSAAHRDEVVCVTRQFLSQFLRLGIAEVNSDLLHSGKNLGGNSQTRLGSG